MDLERAEERLVMDVDAINFFDPEMDMSAAWYGGILVAEREAAPQQVWSLTQFYSVDFSQSRIGVKKSVFNKRTIKVCVSCC